MTRRANFDVTPEKGVSSLPVRHTNRRKPLFDHNIETLNSAKVSPSNSSLVKIENGGGGTEKAQQEDERDIVVALPAS
jgi:hypothetical protein